MERPPELSIFHNLPSGGGIRALSLMLPRLCERFRVRLHQPAGSATPCAPPSCGIEVWDFPESGRIPRAGRLLGPILPMRRLAVFERLCGRIAEAVDTGAPVLVHNSMYVAAPPLLGRLQRAVYYCFEFPRHIYDADLVRRTGSRLSEALLAPLVRMERRMDMEAARAAPATVTLSGYMASRLEAIYGTAPAVVRPGVDAVFFRPSGGGRGRFVLSVGALWPFKGHEDVIRAAGAAGASQVVIVADRGYPGHGKALAALARRSGTSLLVLRGLHDAELRELYRRAGAVACFQHREPYGMVPLEAMACAAPVVAVAEGGLPESVRDGVTGLLVPREEEAMASALSRVLSDVALAAGLGDAGRDFVTLERTPEGAADCLAGALSRSWPRRDLESGPGGA
jgi:glycosyltransferase involved in cell wall biosynthesis